MNHRELSEKLAGDFGYKIVENYKFENDRISAEIDFNDKKIRFRGEIRNGYDLLLCLHELGHHMLNEVEEKRHNELTAWEIGLFFAKELSGFQGDLLSLEDAFKLFMDGIFLGKGWGEGKIKLFSDD